VYAEGSLSVLSVYGQVIKMLGNGRLEAHCFDGKKRLCHIRGKMRKKVWVNTVREYAALLGEKAFLS